MSPVPSSDKQRRRLALERAERSMHSPTGSTFESALRSGGVEISAERARARITVLRADANRRENAAMV
jgi:hypothetical protein